MADVLSSTPCARCGYDLQQLPGSGNCPECGLPIRESVVDTDLEWQDRNWLRTITRGIDLLIVAQVLFVTCWIFANILIERGVHSHSFILVVFPLALCTVGAWLLTTPCERGRAIARRSRVRSILRASAMLPPFAALVFESEYGNFALFASWLTPIFLTFGYIAYICRLARRYRLAKSAEIVMGALPVTLAIPLIAATVAVLQGANSYGVSMYVGLSLLLDGIPLVCSYVGAIAVLVVFSRTLHQVYSGRASVLPRVKIDPRAPQQQTTQ